MSSGQWKPFVFGGLASVTAECGTFPIDLTKTRLQVQGQVGDSKFREIRYRGMLHALGRICREEGLRALYSGWAAACLVSACPLPVQRVRVHPSTRGTSRPPPSCCSHSPWAAAEIAPAVLRQASYGTIKIGTYQSFKRLLVENPEDETLLTNVLCGVLSGVISSSIANPTDVLKIRMQAQGRVIQGGMMGNFIDIYQQEGTRGLWKGVSLTAQRAAIVVGVELPVYDLTKKRLILSGYMGDTVYTHFLSSVVCGLAGALASNPIDVVRTRMMNQRALLDGTSGGYKGTVDCLVKVAPKVGRESLSCMNNREAG
ncbi:kidney mitochondrial carrier protein 1-like [Scleropages formosus]|uniref:Kidney mitochondrial carrier protein 1-like n=1 Tax=Scleropages formosus TaxID=113540 RepID=A0A0P7YBX2_SCLFO|nr:kidney mitochondrial carrier protein 1-like [Scleropages formosus]